MPHLTLKNLPRHDCLLEAACRLPGLDPTACGVFLYLLRTGDEAFRVMDDYFSGHGLSEGRFTVLMILMRRAAEGAKTNTPAELAEVSGVTRATMTGLIDTLERDGLVTRLPDAHDRRMMNVQITPKGQGLLDTLLPEHFRRMAFLMADLTEAERSTLLTLLTKILARASEMPSPRPGPRAVV